MPYSELHKDVYLARKSLEIDANLKSKMKEGLASGRLSKERLVILNKVHLSRWLEMSEALPLSVTLEPYKKKVRMCRVCHEPIRNNRKEFCSVACACTVRGYTPSQIIRAIENRLHTLTITANKLDPSEEVYQPESLPRLRDLQAWLLGEELKVEEEPKITEITEITEPYERKIYETKRPCVCAENRYCPKCYARKYYREHKEHLKKYGREYWARKQQTVTAPLTPTPVL